MNDKESKEGFATFRRQANHGYFLKNRGDYVDNIPIKRE